MTLTQSRGCKYPFCQPPQSLILNILILISLRGGTGSGAPKSQIHSLHWKPFPSLVAHEAPILSFSMHSKLSSIPCPEHPHGRGVPAQSLAPTLAIQYLSLHITAFRSLHISSALRVHTRKCMCRKRRSHRYLTLSMSPHFKTEFKANV